MMSSVAFVALPSLPKRTDRKTHPSRFICCLPSKDVSIPPSSSKTTGHLPECLRGTTILHNIPSIAPHLQPSEYPHHSLDGDGYLLAISYQPTGNPWPRARFVRTKAFMAEAKANRRIYKGAHGTPGSTGWNAPLKPKAASSNGVFVWGEGKKRRVFAFGQRSLPIAVDIANLVARGPTALGNVLTDATELASERGTELAAMPVKVEDGLMVLAVSRTSVGKAFAAFVVEIGKDYSVRKRFGRVDIPGGCVVTDFVVGEEYCVVLLHKEVQGDGGGMLGSLLGRKQSGGSSPEIDTEFGSLIMFVARDGRGVTSCTLPGEIITKVVDVQDAETGKVQLDCLQLVQGEYNGSETKILRSTMADAQSGVVWRDSARSKQLRSNLKRVVVSIAGKNKNEKLPQKAEPQTLEVALCGKDVSILCVAGGGKREGTDTRELICTVFDHERGCTGVGKLRISKGEAKAKLESVWNEGSGVGGVSMPVMSQDGGYVSVLWSCMEEEGGCCAARLMIFEVDDIERGAVHVVELEVGEFGRIGCSVGGVWEREAVDWNEEGGKPVKSGYEIFNSRKWNDIESSFSSLGIGQ